MEDERNPATPPLKTGIQLSSALRPPLAPVSGHWNHHEERKTRHAH